MSLATFALLLLILSSEVRSLKVIETSYGKVRGITEWSNEKNHKYIFKSIPFAKPPVGNLRFELPQPPNSWSGIKDASKYSPACMSNSSESHASQKLIDEDCLYVNIFTSERCLKLTCPVIVYFHGGAFNYGSANAYPEQFLLGRYVEEDVVFAIPAFRLGVFGQLYFGANALLKENLLMFDAVQALKYIHSEIKHFGGDSKHVTIMGHSTGATMVDVLGFSSLVDPGLQLFQQLIVLSGTAKFGYDDLVVENSFIFAEKLGCYLGKKEDRSKADIAEILSCLRNIDGHTLLKIQRQMEEDDLNFRSIIRGAPFLELDGKIADLERYTSPRNLLCGTTEYEFVYTEVQNPHISGSFVDFENPVAVARHFDDEYQNHYDDWPNDFSAAAFVSSATYSSAMAKAGGDVYLFENRQKPFSFHSSDMQYFLGVHIKANRDPDMDILDSFYSELLVNFTKFGEPSPEWKKLEPEKMNYLELKVDTKLGEGPVMKNGYHDTEVNFWLGEMTEYDKNITKMKNEKDASPEYNKISTHQYIGTTLTSLNMETTTSTEKNLNEEATVAAENTIFSQWWFYLLIVLVIMIIVLVVISVRTSNEENLPLLP